MLRIASILSCYQLKELAISMKLDRGTVCVYHATTLGFVFYWPYEVKNCLVERNRTVSNSVFEIIYNTYIYYIQFSPLQCYLVPLSPKYSPQHPILKDPQPAFLPQCQRPSFTTIQITQKIIVPCILVHIFGQQTGRQKILHRMIASFL